MLAVVYRAQREEGREKREGEDKPTRKEALYGTAIGKLAIIAKSLLAVGERKARLWEISWMARNKFWLQVAPKT